VAGILGSTVYHTLLLGSAHTLIPYEVRSTESITALGVTGNIMY
jgi:hypothetical protein